MHNPISGIFFPYELLPDGLFVHNVFTLVLFKHLVPYFGNVNLPNLL